MYSMEYCSNPNNPHLEVARHSFDDSIADTYERKVTVLDNYMFLIDLFQIMESCQKDFYEIPKGNITFKEINKLFISYINSVYCYKEYISHLKPSAKEIIKDYYEKQKWYRFICDYRNRVVHQTMLIRDFAPNTGDIYIDLDSVIQMQKDEIKRLERGSNTNAANYIESNNRFIAELEQIRNNQYVKGTGNSLKSMKDISALVSNEISQMHKEILAFMFEKAVAPAIRWLLSKTYRFDGKYQYTYLVNHQVRIELEPNYAIEDHLFYILEALGKDHDISKSFLQLLKDEQYTFSYHKMAFLDDVFN